MIALVDMDGVITDFTTTAMVYHNITFNTVSKYPEKYDWMYGLMPPKDFWQPLGEKFYTNLPWIKDGKEILSIIENAFDDIYLLSSPTMNTGCWSGKMLWIEKHLPRYKRRIMLGSNKYLCAGLDRILFDDSEENITKFRKYDGHGILVPRPWNANRNLNTIEYIKERIKNVKGLQTN